MLFFLSFSLSLSLLFDLFDGDLLSTSRNEADGNVDADVSNVQMVASCSSCLDIMAWCGWWMLMGDLHAAYIVFGRDLR